MKCTFCQAENGPNANFCSNCGSPLNLQVCPKCEAVNEKTAATCMNCGQALVEHTNPGSGDNDTTAAAPTDDSAAIQTPAATDNVKALLQDIEEEIKRQRSARDAEGAVDKSSRLEPQQSPAAEETVIEPVHSRAWREEVTFFHPVRPRSWLPESLLVVALVGGIAAASYYFLYFSAEAPPVGYANDRATGTPITPPAPLAEAPANRPSPDAAKSTSERATSGPLATPAPPIVPPADMPSPSEAKSTSEQAAGGPIARPAPPEGTSSAIVGSPTIASPQADSNDKGLHKDNVTKKLGPGVAAKKAQTSSERSRYSTDQPQTSHLTFSVSPSAEIYVDGKKWGMSPPLLGLALSPGEHLVEIRSKNLPPYYEHIKLQPGETLKIEYKFR